MTYVPKVRTYDEKTKDIIYAPGDRIVDTKPINQVDEYEAMVIGNLKKLQQENLQKEQEWAIYKKYKQK